VRADGGGAPLEDPDAEMTPDSEQDVRDQALAYLRKRRKFFVDATSYATVNGVLWVIWAVADRSFDGGMPWPAWVSSIWGFFLAMDGVKVFSRWGRALHRPITEADVQREIERSRHAT
jgi:2TM domain